MSPPGPQRGCFITVEGVEGAGKSTCLGQIRARLEAAGKEVVCTREPGGTPLGEEIRGLLLAHREDGMSADAELLLMFAARAEHLARLIRPALDAGRWVLCDRFTDATVAYQGGGRGIPSERIAAIREWVHDGLEPDLTLVLDLPVELGLRRAGGRSEPDRFEREADAFFRRVRAAYLDLARAEPERIRVVDASLALEEVQMRIARVIDGFLAAR
jgi:dTMP kinase